MSLSLARVSHFYQVATVDPHTAVKVGWLLAAVSHTLGWKLVGCLLPFRTNSHTSRMSTKIVTVAHPHKPATDGSVNVSLSPPTIIHTSFTPFVLACRRDLSMAPTTMPLTGRQRA